MTEPTYLDDDDRVHIVGVDICYDLIEPVDYLYLQCPLVGVAPGTSNNVTRTWSKVTEGGENHILFSVIDSVRPQIEDGQEFYDRFPEVVQSLIYGFHFNSPDIYPHDLVFYANPMTDEEFSSLLRAFGTWNCTVSNASGSDTVLTTISLSDCCEWWVIYIVSDCHSQ